MSRTSDWTRRRHEEGGVLGTGTVGTILADGFLAHGYAVMRGTRDPSKLAEWKANAGPLASVGTFDEAARFAYEVVLHPTTVNGFP